MKTVTFGGILLLSITLSLYIGFIAGKNRTPSAESADTVVATYKWQGQPVQIALKDLAEFTQVDQSEYKKMIYRTRKQAIESLIANKLRANLELDKVDFEPVSQNEFDEMVKKLKLNPSKLTDQQRRDILGNLSIGKRNQQVNQKIQAATADLDLQIELKPPFEFVKRPGQSGVTVFRPTEKKAKIQITWFGNFHCPQCLPAFEKIKFALEKFPNQFAVDFIYHGQDPDQSAAFLTAKGIQCLEDLHQSKTQGRSTVDTISRIMSHVPTDLAEVKSVLTNGDPSLNEMLSACLEDRSKNQKLREAAERARQIAGAPQNASFLIFGDYFVPGAELMDLFQDLVSVSSKM